MSTLVSIEPYWVNADAIAYLGANQDNRSQSTLIIFIGGEELTINKPPQEVVTLLKR